MTQKHPRPPERIVCEDVTDELVAAYRARGFVLAFAEEVMRYDLTRAFPHSSAPAVGYRPWDAGSRGTFFAVYTAAFRERPGFPGWSEEEWLRWTGDDPTFRPDLSFLATRQGQALGFVTNAESEKDPQRSGYLIQLGVAPRWRGQGLGTALTLRALQAWRSAGRKAVVLHVNSNNPGALRLYQRLGFVRIKRRGAFDPM
jgi:mycothiol synthase